jgi:hypothetical protein
MLKEALVTARWDAEGRCWVASSSDVRGLALWGPTRDDIAKKAAACAPALLAANNQVGQFSDVRITFE